MMIRILILAALAAISSLSLRADDLFRDEVAPLLARRCLSCHNDSKPEGGLSMTRPVTLVDDYVDRSNGSASHLLTLITPQRGRAEMPKDADPLTS